VGVQVQLDDDIVGGGIRLENVAQLTLIPDEEQG
jgi:hypothetical protein